MQIIAVVFPQGGLVANICSLLTPKMTKMFRSSIRSVQQQADMEDQYAFTNDHQSLGDNKETILSSLLKNLASLDFEHNVSAFRALRRERRNCDSCHLEAPYIKG
jgi:hypothetical protein